MPHTARTLGKVLGQTGLRCMKGGKPASMTKNAV